jgi:hypothetical protein
MTGLEGERPDRRLRTANGRVGPAGGGAQISWFCSAARSQCGGRRARAWSADPAACTPRPWRGQSPDLARHCAPSGIGDPARAVRPSRLSTSAGRQARPLHPVRSALGRGRRPPDRGPYGLVRPAGRPCGTAGRPVVTGGTGFSSRNPPRRCRMVTLAGWARQPAQSVRRPARGNRPGPVVRLPERGRIRESGPAPRHGTPGRRNPDLVTNDTTPGDRNRVNQRIERHRRLRGFAITVSRDTEGRRLSPAASPPGHARPPGVPGKTS